MKGINVSTSQVKDIVSSDTNYLLKGSELDIVDKQLVLTDGEYIYGDIVLGTPEEREDEYAYPIKEWQEWDDRMEFDAPDKDKDIIEEIKIKSPTEKLYLKEFRETRTDPELENPKDNYRALLMSLRILGNSAWPRLQEGKDFGNWDKDITRRYFGKIISVLRDKLKFPLIPPEEGDEDYDTSYWELYREAKDEGYITVDPPPKDEVDDWDEEREEILEKDVFSIVEKLKGKATSEKTKDINYREENLREIYEELPEKVLIVPDWLSVSGGEVYASEDREPHDTDVVVRDPQMPAGSAEKFSRIFENITERPAHIVPESQGPTWSALNAYNLVAVKKPEFQIDRMDQSEPDFARDFYKESGTALEDILPMLEPGEGVIWPKELVEKYLEKTDLTERVSSLDKGDPIAHYGVYAEEFYSGDEKKLWKDFVKPILDDDKSVYIQPKADGFRFALWKLENDFKIYLEKGEERSNVFPDLDKALDKLDCEDCLLDLSMIELEDNDPKPRWSLAWAGGADEQPDVETVRLIVHDIYYLDGEIIADQPYKKRFDKLLDILPEKVNAKQYDITPAPNKILKPDSEFGELGAALDWGLDQGQVATEGNMLKDSTFKIKNFSDAQPVAKFKQSIEIDCQIIGWRKVPTDQPQDTHWTSDEAMDKWPERLENSDTYMFRVALKDSDGNYIPLRSDQQVSAGDLDFHWDEEDQEMEGMAGEEVWTMLNDFDQLTEDDLQYNKTYAMKLTTGNPEWGDIVTVAPEQVIPWVDDQDNQHLSWSHPRAVLVKRDKPAGSINEVLNAFGHDPEDYGVFKEIEDGLPKQFLIIKKLD